MADESTIVVIGGWVGVSVSQLVFILLLKRLGGGEKSKVFICSGSDVFLFPSSLSLLNLFSSAVFSVLMSAH